MSFGWQRGGAWEMGISLIYLKGDYVRLDVNIGRWGFHIGHSFEPKYVAPPSEKDYGGAPSSKRCDLN